MAITDDSGSEYTASGGETSRADVAKQEASQVSGTVKEQGAAVTGAAAEGGQRVAAQAKEQVGALASQAQNQFHEVLGRSQSEFSERASEQTDKAAANLRSLSEEFHALADGRPQDASRAVGYVRQVADRAEGYATRLDNDGFAGVASDLSRFARRRPGLFLLASVAAGFAAGRLVRGAKAADGSGSDDPSVTAGQSSVSPPPADTHDPHFPVAPAAGGLGLGSDALEGGSIDIVASSGYLASGRGLSGGQ